MENDIEKTIKDLYKKFSDLINQKTKDRFMKLFVNFNDYDSESVNKEEEFFLGIVSERLEIAKEIVELGENLKTSDSDVKKIIADAQYYVSVYGSSGKQPVAAEEIVEPGHESSGIQPGSGE